ncbi:oligosaccharide flippase family protein [Adlercreutzia sp. R7]|uniref:Oligosaccharide flippase family protein n=1 Tax=Adlercreutzia wanghongyangiae TaxID=3111451 RepID=A0ABU6IH08_9ACTN|nr:oligosaccharide flippase family protein [Adlercreutzia sp. R7]
MTDAQCAGFEMPCETRWIDRLQVVKKILGRLLHTGFFHIFGAGTINKIISALLSIVVVRILSKEDFGIYSYVYNLISFFVLFNGLGATSALLQLGCEAQSNGAIASVLRYATKVGVLFDLLLAVFVLIASFAPMGFPESSLLLRLYALYPFVIFLFDIRIMIFRIKLYNKQYAFITNIQTLLLALLSIAGALCWQVVGLIVGQYLAYILSGSIAWFVGMRLRVQEGEEADFDFDKKAYWKISVASSINNGLGSALTLVGVFFVGLFCGNETAVAEYKVATTIPFALLFIPSAVVTYLYPYFVKHRDDVEWSLSRYLQLSMVGLAAYGSVVVLFCVFGGSIVSLVFGSQYESATQAFRIIMIGFFVTAALRQPTGNLLVTQRRLWFNTATGVISLLVCCAACAALIPIWGIEGAAWAYTFSMIAGALCSVPYYIFVLLKKREGGIGEK